MDTSATPFLHAISGFGLGMALIAAIGAQNAYVLRQGIRREHVLPIVLICAASDAILIALGVVGVGAVVRQMPEALLVVRWLGAGFLFLYALLALRRALTPGRLPVDANTGTPPVRSVVLTCLALTWLNPHVYLDTVLLLGSVASGQGDAGRWYFGLGAVVASAVWFTGLGFGARLLGGLFAHPRSWRFLDGFVAAVMAALGLQLVLLS